MAYWELGRPQKSPRSSREKPPQHPKSCRKRWTIVLKSTLQKKPWDRKRRRVRNRTDHLTTSRNPSQTNQPQRAVLAQFNWRSYARRGPMACPGLRRALIGITDIPGMKIGTRAVTPATMVPLGNCRNGDVHPTTTAVNIDVRHHRQVRKRIQRQGQQLLPTLVATIQWDSRGRHGSLVLRAGIAVQRPSRQPLTCQGVRPPAVRTCLVIRDRHSRRHTRHGSTDHLVSMSTPTHKGLTTDRFT